MKLRNPSQIGVLVLIFLLCVFFVGFVREGFCQEKKPSGPRTISFSGHKWKVKNSRHTKTGPGPNYFSDSEDNVWVDGTDQLHLKITNKTGRWFCAEVINEKNLGYGRYIFYLASRVDQLNENVVLGLFTWSDAPEYTHRELEFEFSKWGQPGGPNVQFVVQPYEVDGHIHKFNFNLVNKVYSTHSFLWKQDSVCFQSVYGDKADPSDAGDIIESWVCTVKDIPVPGDENVRFNLWLYYGSHHPA